MLFLCIITGKIIFADWTQMTLWIKNTIASISYQPAFSPWFFTSGNVIATITWSNITGTLYYTITENWTYSFPYLRGTWPYTSGLAYGPTNLRNTLMFTDTITRIDTLPPIYEIHFSSDGNSMLLNFSDNSPWIQIVLNGNLYTGSFPILLTTPWTYVFIVTDIAGNKVGFSITVFTPEPANSGWGGGWGGGSIGGVIEAPPCTPSDLICVQNNYVTKPGKICDIWTWYNKPCKVPDTHQPHPAPDITSGSISWSHYSLELTNAYLRAHAYGITTAPTIEQANMTGTLKRKNLAKMISEFTLQFTDKKPDVSKKCIFSDMSKESKEMQIYSILACQLGLMWLEEDGTTPKKTFNPNTLVSRAQFGVVLSRLLFGDTYNIKEGERALFVKIENGIKTFISKIWNILMRQSVTPSLQLVWYAKHLQALKTYDIMRKIDKPTVLERKWYVMLMLMRADINWIIKQ